MSSQVQTIQPVWKLAPRELCSPARTACRPSLARKGNYVADELEKLACSRVDCRVTNRILTFVILESVTEYQRFRVNYHD